MDLDGEDIPGEDLGPLLLGDGGEAIARALIGCDFYEDDPDQPRVITAFVPERSLLRLAGADGSSRSRALAMGYVVLSDGLRGALRAAISPAFAAQDRQRRALAAFGFRTRIEADDLAPLLAAVEAARDCRMPFRDDRFTGLRLAGKYGTSRECARLASAWLSGAPDPAPGDLVIALVSALRDSGRFGEALAATEILTRKGNGLDRAETRILSVQRGALWLDSYETRPDPECLDRAEQCAKRAWAIAPSEECSALFNRLRHLRRQLDG